MGSAYTLTTDATAGSADSSETGSKDSTSQMGKKEMSKMEKTTKSDSMTTKDGKASEAAADTVTTASGLKYVITKEGKGDVAKSGQNVAVHYAGRLASNGKEFDNSFKRQKPIEFKLGIGRVIKGWDEGIAGMRVGEERTLIIPSELGYGKRGAGGAIPPNATLIFDVQLVAVK
ncbi:FKBP-type peptidyl-prolyl cis-trans isomerase [bacterium AH-315-J21]|nr:FKBP-type peptidyl-prolyl cis-trans isomerase [bacterium AH-315-J21]